MCEKKGINDILFYHEWKNMHLSLYVENGVRLCNNRHIQPNGY